MINGKRKLISEALSIAKGEKGQRHPVVNIRIRKEGKTIKEITLDPN